MSLKLLVHKEGSRVLFAEVPKEFVDFLFHIFSLPLGTLIDQFLGSEQMVGCLGKLKDSIECLHENYLQPGIEMDDIFNPKTGYNGDTFLLPYDASSKDQSRAYKAVYMCANGTGNCYGGYYTYCRSNPTLHMSQLWLFYECYES
ncbi:hypothetical protein L1987_62257 [Smallanthus sonchifolius]|uniref:Uncharacterized protein n=1 Tax=Smallanthus sonchifolius TaxID=185202 RepID=A0ACB9C9W0_9ASTR|nr:hypothetical protein L1987_62257 [Smallanthus sonchifolius]